MPLFYAFSLKIQKFPQLLWKKCYTKHIGEIELKTIKDLDIKNKTVIIRCDFNVPIKNGKILDDTRIKESLKTIEYALAQDSKIILLSHLGRIKTEQDLALNDLAIVAPVLEKMLHTKVHFLNATRGPIVENFVHNMKVRDIVLLQNTRYEDLKGNKESSNDPELGKYWASLGDVFINDAFGTIHRSHASNVGIETNLESAAGFLVEKEINALSSLDKPQHPYLVILGGAKVSDKIGVINNLITKADYILIGGGMAFTFLKAKSYEVGNSLVDESHLEYCKDILNQYSDKIILPVDFICAPTISNDNSVTIKGLGEIASDEMGLDIGPQTINLFSQYLASAKTVVWNGPMGAYEYKPFQEGTNCLLSFLAEHNIKTIIGGGDTVAAVKNKPSLAQNIYHISTGGGATLEYLEGKDLEALKLLN